MTYSNYEFTAISEAQIISGNGSSINCGDMFEMPAAAALCITVRDNDSFLSGDSWCNENANDHYGQHATIEGDSGEVGNGHQIYAESYFWVCDDAGNWYVMVNIEQEGTNENYYTFYTGHGYTTPEAGTKLTVYSECNVKSDFLDYKCLDGGDKVEVGTISGTVFCDTDCDGLSQETVIEPGCDYTIEAESMHSWGFHQFHSTTASGGAGMKLGYDSCKNETGYGDLWTYFDGKDGVYDLKLFVQDECDGCSVIKIKINGHVEKVIYLDENNEGGGSDNGTFTPITISDLNLKDGDKITLWADGKGGEFVRIDKIELEGQDREVKVDEPVKAGVTIKLLDADTGAVVATTMTDANGNYKFENVVAGDYKIMGVAPDGTEFTIKDAGTDDSIDSDVDENGMSGVITVTGGSETDIDLGVCEKPEPGSLSGRYFCDDDADGAESAGDSSIVGATVILLDAAGNEVARTTTGTDGIYRFDDLEAGQYRVVFEQPDDIPGQIGKEFIAPNQGDDATDSDADPATGETGLVTVEAGEETKDVDAGIVDPADASIAGRVFCDEDDNSLDDAEPGVANVTVNLISGGMIVATTTTGADGSYAFTGLKAGTYSVDFAEDDADLAGKVLVTQDVDGNVSDDIDSDADETDGTTGDIVLNAGENVTDIDAGVEDPGTASLSGRVFCDENDNSLDDAEDGVANVTVRLLFADGTPTGLTTTTNADGSYEFTDLLAGGYIVEFDKDDTDLGGKILVEQDVDGNVSDTIDSDASETDGRTNVITVAIGEEVEDIDAGVEEPNTPPTATDDMGKGCADELITVDLSDNVSDADSTSVDITMLGGLNISDGQTIVLNGFTTTAEGYTGLEVTRNGDEFVFDGEMAFAALDIGEEATISLEYKVEDSDGATATATVDVTFCGDANTAESLDAALKAAGTQVTFELAPLASFADFVDGYTFDLLSSTNAGISLGNVPAAYCLDQEQDISLSVVTTANVCVLTEDNLAAVAPTVDAGNFDSINWLLNFDQTLVDNGDGTGDTYTDYEVQEAIWVLMNGETNFLNQFGLPELADDDNGVRDGAEIGTLENINEIVATAIAQGDGYVAGDGDVIGLILDPVDPASQDQPFVIGVAFDDIDCIC
jgi:protocatechuate 3,4-dioxygenase beta subunit